jgi:hypothetical protein
MHEKQWGGSENPRGVNKVMTNTKGWASPSTKTTPRSVSTTITAERSIIRYDITRTKQRFMKSNHAAGAPTDNVWIGISHVFLPTLWCPKCEKWVSHPKSLNDDHTRWQTAKDAQKEKIDQDKRNNHYGPPHHQNRNYERDDTNKKSSTSYNRDHNQDKRSRNDRGRSPSQDCSNSQTHSPRSPGDNHKDNHRQGASFYDGKKTY